MLLLVFPLDFDSLVVFVYQSCGHEIAAAIAGGFVDLGEPVDDFSPFVAGVLSAVVEMLVVGFESFRETHSLGVQINAVAYDARYHSVDTYCPMYSNLSCASVRDNSIIVFANNTTATLNTHCQELLAMPQ